MTTGVVQWIIDRCINCELRAIHHMILDSINKILPMVTKQYSGAFSERLPYSIWEAVCLIDQSGSYQCLAVVIFPLKSIYALINWDHLNIILTTIYPHQYHQFQIHCCDDVCSWCTYSRLTIHCELNWTQPSIFHIYAIIVLVYEIQRHHWASIMNKRLPSMFHTPASIVLLYETWRNFDVNYELSKQGCSFLIVSCNKITVQLVARAFETRSLAQQDDFLCTV
jgi:hypothetical protein